MNMQEHKKRRLKLRLKSMAEGGDQRAKDRLQNWKAGVPIPDGPAKAPTMSDPEHLMMNVNDEKVGETLPSPQLAHMVTTNRTMPAAKAVTGRESAGGFNSHGKGGPFDSVRTPSVAPRRNQKTMTAPETGHFPGNKKSLPAHEYAGKEAPKASGVTSSRFAMKPFARDPNYKPPSGEQPGQSAMAAPEGTGDTQTRAARGTVVKGLEPVATSGTQPSRPPKTQRYPGLDTKFGPRPFAQSKPGPIGEQPGQEKMKTQNASAPRSPELGGAGNRALAEYPSGGPGGKEPGVSGKMKTVVAGHTPTKMEHPPKHKRRSKRANAFYGRQGSGSYGEGAAVNA